MLSKYKYNIHKLFYINAGNYYAETFRRNTREMCSFHSPAAAILVRRGGRPTLFNLIFLFVLFFFSRQQILLSSWRNYCAAEVVQNGSGNSNCFTLRLKNTIPRSARATATILPRARPPPPRARTTSSVFYDIGMRNDRTSGSCIFPCSARPSRGTYTSGTGVYAKFAWVFFSVLLSVRDPFSNNGKRTNDYAIHTRASNDTRLI